MRGLQRQIAALQREVGDLRRDLAAPDRSETGEG